MDRVYEQGDILYLDFTPQAGHEQAGRKPGIVISNKIFNTYTGMIMVCPITRTYRNYPLHVQLKDEKKITGVIMCEQLRSIDPVARNADFIEKASDSIIEAVLNRIRLFFDN